MPASLLSIKQLLVGWFGLACFLGKIYGPVSPFSVSDRPVLEDAHAGAAGDACASGIRRRESHSEVCELTHRVG